MLRVLALATNTDNAAFRYRVGQFIEPLREHGIDVHARRVPRNGAERLAALDAAREFDLVWLLRCRLGRQEARRLRDAAERLVFEFDDAIWVRDSLPLIRVSLGRRLSFRRLTRAADLVVAGNAFLARRARPGAKRVDIVPTCLDLTRYRPGGDRGGAEVVDLVWIGQAGTLRYLERIVPALDEVARRRTVRLRVIADAFPRTRRIEVVRAPWSAATEAEDLACGHIGLAPLTNDSWARGKCGLKDLQYMAAGLPVAASPVGVQAAMVGRDERGCLARSVREWTDRLLALIDDEAERARRGREGRRWVEAGYSLDAWVPRVATLLRTVAGSGGSTP